MFDNGRPVGLQRLVEDDGAARQVDAA